MGSSLIVLVAQSAELLLPLLRTVALARILSPEQFGIAVSVQLLIAVTEMVCDIGLPLLAVQVGGRRLDLGAIHLLNVARSLAMCVVYAGLVLVYLAVYDVAPHPALFLLPLLVLGVRGFENFGHKPLMRRYSFWREALINTAMQLVLTVVAVGASLVTRDFSGLLWGMAAGYLAMAVLSQALSPTRWRPAWSRPTVRRALRFGLPLIPNGAASALAFGDRLVVGAVLGPAALALYSVVMSTVHLPRTAALRLANTLLIPRFINVTSPVARTTGFELYVSALAIVAFGYGAGLCALGKPVVALLFGSNYDPPILLVCLIGANAFVKLVGVGPAPPSYAWNRTPLVFYGTLSAAVAMVPASVVLYLVPRLEVFLLVLTGCEALALAWFLHLVGAVCKARGAVLALATWLPLAALLAVAAAATVWSPTLPVWVAFVAAVAMATVAVHLLALAWLGVVTPAAVRGALRGKGRGRT